MRLVTAKNLRTKIKVRLLVSAEDTRTLRALKVGKRFYPYVARNGYFKNFGALFEKEPGDVVYRYKNDSKFRDAADHLFGIDLSESNIGDLKGSRIDPAYVEIRKATPRDGNVEIVGEMRNAYDPRLAHMSKSEETEYGAGEFSLDNAYALYDGSYFYDAMSPMAESIERIAKEQEAAFEKLKADPEDDAAKKTLDETSFLLRPHSYESYKRDEDLLYYVSAEGKWQLLNLEGNRKLDFYDKKKILDRLREDGLINPRKGVAQDLRANRENLHALSVFDRFDFDHTAALFARELNDREDEIDEAYEEATKKRSEVKPSDGLDEVFPGLKEGIEFPGHQAYAIGKLKQADRMIADLDAGAGKTVVILADILLKLAEGRAKRPLVVVPQYLINNFAEEVRNFTSLNPWIISTQSIRNWSDGTFEKFLADAAKAPANTVYITSYNWLSQAKKHVPNGKVKKTAEGKFEYQTTKVFTNSYALLNTLGVDAVYMDEAHLLRSSSNQSRAASVFAKVPIVRALTGTLMPGNLVDVLGPAGIVQSAVFETADKFLADFSKDGTINSYRDEAPKEIREKLIAFGVPQIRASAWAHFMPKTTRQYHYVSFNKNQEEVYNDLLKGRIEEIRKNPKLWKEFVKFRNALDDNELVMSKGLRERFTPLDIFLNAPAKADRKFSVAITGDDALSPKVAKINEIATKHLADPNNGKVLVLAQFRESAKAIYNGLDPIIKEEAAYYDGQHTDALVRFKNPDTTPKILIAVDRTLTLGHNLQVANCLIHADTLWLPGEMDQRKARIARYKQTRHCYVHHIIVENSAEILKNARVLSAEHTIAKANSDFEDKTVMPYIEMTEKGMERFRGKENLKDFVKAQEKIEEFRKSQEKKDQEFYGMHLLKARGYEKIKVGEQLTRVPSTKYFNGNLAAAPYQVEDELAKLPTEPERPGFLKFDLQSRDGDWYVIVFKAGDPTGFVRKLGFSLQVPYLYTEVPSKGGITSLMDDLEEGGIEIVDKASLEEAIDRMAKVSRPGTLTDLAKKAVAAKKEAQDIPVSFSFATIDTFPIVYTDSVRMSDPAATLLKKLKFKEGPPYWYLRVDRTKLLALLKKIQENFPDVKVSHWDDFKELVSKAFRADISDFDALSGKGAGE